MSGRSKHSAEIKLIAVQRYQNGESATKLSREIDVDVKTIRIWTKKYDAFGIDGLKEKGTWTRYSIELKITAVEDYLNGKGSLRDICSKYGIRNNSTLRNWILKYNNNK